MITSDLKRSGIYAIIHKESGKLYVGSAVSLQGRWFSHISFLNRNMHDNQKLQRAWNKYGEDAFAFVVICFCEQSQLIATEQRWLDETEAIGPWGYNIAPQAGSRLGIKASQEARDKMSQSRRGKKRSPETVAKTAAAHRGMKRSPETRAKMSAINKARVITPEHRAKMAEGKRGKKRSPESVAKSAAAHRGKLVSAESVAKRKATIRSRKLARMSMVQGELFD